MKKICILTPVKNEEDNIDSFIQAIKEEIIDEKDYCFEHILIDNCSTDSTRAKITKIIETNRHVGAIFNRRDFGSSRSQFHALKSVNADAVILIAADFQEPISLIKPFIRNWEQDHLVVGGVKKSSSESAILFLLRSLYYKVLSSISEVKPLKGYLGFALYDRQVINEIKKINDSNPYIRGLPTDLGFTIKELPYHQPIRKKGKSKAPLLVLLDVAINGMTSHSIAPIRFASILGLITSLFSFLVGLAYFIYKLIYWDSFEVGVAPLIIFITFAFSLQILFIGLVGEYIAKISTEIMKRPLVVEEKRLNYPVDKEINLND